MTTRFPTDPSMSRIRLAREFFTRDVLMVAPDLLAKVLAVREPDGAISRFIISETEAYRGTDDKACHACRGRTSRTDIMFHDGGRLYVYLVYGMHWMLNVVTGSLNDPQAALIRGFENCYGPGRATKLAGIDRSFNGEDLTSSERIWLEDDGVVPDYKTGERIGIDYAGEYWKARPWRFFL